VRKKRTLACIRAHAQSLRKNARTERPRRCTGDLRNHYLSRPPEPLPLGLVRTDTFERAREREGESERASERERESVREAPLARWQAGEGREREGEREGEREVKERERENQTLEGLVAEDTERPRGCTGCGAPQCYRGTSLVDT
jgi:hypothetical protein